MVRGRKYNIITKINVDYFRHRRITIALMLALLVSVITGCGTKEDPSTNNNEESTFAVSSEIKENEESKSGSKTSAEKKTHRKYYK